VWGEVPDALRVDEVVTQGKTKKNEDDHETHIWKKSLVLAVSHMSQFQEGRLLIFFFFFFFFQKKVTSCDM
jgi:hypothetical protein